LTVQAISRELRNPGPVWSAQCGGPVLTDAADWLDKFNALLPPV
jgi:hypothetical protein